MAMCVVSLMSYANFSTVHSDTMHIKKVNDSTMLFIDIERLEIHQPESVITYVYKDSGELIYANKGDFDILLKEGNYLIFTTKKISEAHIERKEEIFSW